MTTTELHHLPECLRPRHVRAILGVSDESLRVLRAQHPAIVIRKCGQGRQGQYIYSKREIFTLARLEYSEPFATAR